MKLRKYLGVGLALTLGVVISASVGTSAWANPQLNQIWLAYGNQYLGNPAAVNADMPIRTQNGSRCIDADGNNFYPYWQTNGYPLNSTRLQVWDCNNGGNQRWTQQDNGDGSWAYYLDDQYNGLQQQPYCMDSLGGHNYDGAPVQVWACNLGNLNRSQKWTIGPRSQLQSVDSPGKCLDVDNPNFQWADAPNGAKLQLWDCVY